MTNAGIITEERGSKKWYSNHNLNLHKSRRIESTYNNFICTLRDIAMKG